MLPKSFLCGLGQAASLSLHSHTESAEQQQQLCITGVFRVCRLDVARGGADVGHRAPLGWEGEVEDAAQVKI